MGGYVLTTIGANWAERLTLVIFVKHLTMYRNDILIDIIYSQLQKNMSQHPKADLNLQIPLVYIVYKVL